MIGGKAVFTSIGENEVLKVSMQSGTAQSGGITEAKAGSMGLAM